VLAQIRRIFALTIGLPEHIMPSSVASLPSDPIRVSTRFPFALSSTLRYRESPAMKTQRCGHTLTLLALAILGATAVAHAQTFSVKYNFGTNTGEPNNPQYEGIITQGRDGNLYSTAPGGGIGSGAMFKITPTGKLTVQHSFDAGSTPYSGLTLGTDGNFYGTTYSGGTSRLGTIFKITPSGTLAVLYNFTGSDGSTPFAPPIQGADGNFYGTTQGGGTNSLGTVYKLTPSGKLTTLYSFDGTHGNYPYAPLVQGTDGNFYGTTQQGGTAAYGGTVYKITPVGKLTVLYNFDTTHGSGPFGPLVQGGDGNFYGATSSGGTKGGGVVFSITGTGKLTVLHNINGTTDGADPRAGLVQATDGNLYGVNITGGSANLGTIFSISPIKPYPYKVLYNFDGTTGANPQVTLLQHTNGILYGDTYTGGTGPCGCGTFFGLDMKLKQFASLVSTSGKVGKTIGILGKGFTGTTGVSFNGSAATFKVVSDTYLTATISNLASTGFVNVKTPGGTLTSNKQFRVTPFIISFSPNSGPVGTPVKISGSSFTGATKVTFSGVKATTFSVDSDMQITANVPTAAKTGKIAITTPGGTATSKNVFTVTQ
jgi:uncharacterized repeat protein (TIGR03803 family)